MNTRYPDTTEVPVAIPSQDGESVTDKITITVPCRIDKKTGEVILGGEALRMIDRAKARYMGLLRPDEISALRERLGMTQKQMCELLQIGGKSYSRWENGRERPSRSMNLLLRSINDGKLSVAYLQTLGERKTDWWAVAYNWPNAQQSRKPFTIDVSGHETAKPTCLEENYNASQQSAA